MAFGNAMRADVSLSPNAVGSAAPGAPWDGGAGVRFTGLPSIAMRVMTMPSVSSAGTHGARCGVNPVKRFMSSRRTMFRSESGLLLWITTDSRPVMREVAGSSRAWIV